MMSWTKLPSAWIENRELHAFRWAQGEGANNIAALMVLAVIAHHIEPQTGSARLTYSDLSDKASLSRAKVSAGLGLLEARGLVDRYPDCSFYRLRNYDPNAGWAMFPAKGLYHNDVVAAFEEFRLRVRSELDALKLYFLFAARRNRDTNYANISYPKIEEYSGVDRNHIRRALSVLAAHGLVHVQYCDSTTNENGTANAYRLAHIEPRNHMGTRGRADTLRHMFGGLPEPTA